MASHPLPVISHQSEGGKSERTQQPSKNGNVKHNHLHVHQNSPLLPFVHWRAASTVIHLFPKGTVTPSIQANLGLPRTSPPLTSAINTLLARWYSSVLSERQNYINTLWSTLFTDSIILKLFYAPLHSQHYPFVTLPSYISITSSQEHHFHFLSHQMHPEWRIDKVVALHAVVERSIPTEVAPIYTMHEALREYCPWGWGVRPVNWIYRLWCLCP